jgi:hypothetical protein
MNSIPFGRNREVEPTEKKELVLDYVWRKGGHPNDIPIGRYKVIVDPQKVISFSIHYVEASSVPLPRGNVYKVKADELRINHYKQPDNGAYWKFKKKTYPGQYLALDKLLFCLP